MLNLKIFVSSPGDVGSEREICIRIIDRVQASFVRHLTLTTYLWEHEPMEPIQDFQSNIDDPGDYDIVICILWSRLGTRLHSRHRRDDDTTYRSGTEYEFERALEARNNRGGV